MLSSEDVASAVGLEEVKKSEAVAGRRASRAQTPVVQPEISVVKEGIGIKEGVQHTQSASSETVAFLDGPLVNDGSAEAKVKSVIDSIPKLVSPEALALLDGLNEAEQRALFLALWAQSGNGASELAVLKAAGDHKGKGSVTIVYNHYSKVYEIEDGKLHGEDFFDVAYALGKGTRLHLALQKAENKEGSVPDFLEELGGFTYTGLDDGKTYYVHTEMADDQEENLKVDRERRLVERKAQDELEALGGKEYNNEDTSSCSCLEGNPCVVEYNCRYWSARFEIAKKNGKGARAGYTCAS